MHRAVEQLNVEVNKIENLRNQETKKRSLEVELISARNAEAEQVINQSNRKPFHPDFFV